MKNILFSILTVLSLTASAQENLYMKDGTLLGKRTDLVKSCVEGMGDSQDLQGFNKESICDCMLVTLAKHFTMKEFNKMTNNPGFDFQKLFYDKKKPELGEDLFACILSNAADMKTGDTAGGSFQKEFINSCKEEVAKSADLKDYDAEVYCVCAFNKMKEKNLKISELRNLGKDPNSAATNEIAIPCLEEARLNKGKKNNNDVSGEKTHEEIPLLKLANIYRVKVRIGKTEKYFTLDSGASNMLIDKDMAKELTAANIITKDNYLGEGQYTLADGRKVKAKNYMLNGIGIGNFTINNVEIGVLDTETGSLLCGKSLLDKFSMWKVDNENSTLILEK